VGRCQVTITEKNHIPFKKYGEICWGSKREGPIRLYDQGQEEKKGGGTSRKSSHELTRDDLYQRALKTVRRKPGVGIFGAQKGEGWTVVTPR